MVQICFVLFCIQIWFCVVSTPKFLIPFLCSSNNCQLGHGQAKSIIETLSCCLTHKLCAVQVAC